MHYFSIRVIKSATRYRKIGIVKASVLKDAKVSSGTVAAVRGLCVAIVVVAVMGGKVVRVTERRDVTRTGSVADARPFLVV